MKITKTTREYIEAQVRIKADNSARLVSLQENADSTTREFRKDIEALNERITKEIRSVAKKYQIETFEGYKYHTSILSEHKIPAVIKYWDAVTDTKIKAKNATLEIIATMELGGTKAELMEMLNNLEF